MPTYCRIQWSIHMSSVFYLCLSLFSYSRFDDVTSCQFSTWVTVKNVWLCAYALGIFNCICLYLSSLVQLTWLLLTVHYFFHKFHNGRDTVMCWTSRFGILFTHVLHIHLTHPNCVVYFYVTDTSFCFIMS